MHGRMVRCLRPCESLACGHISFTVYPVWASSAFHSPDIFHTESVVLPLESEAYVALKYPLRTKLACHLNTVLVVTPRALATSCFWAMTVPFGSHRAPII